MRIVRRASLVFSLVLIVAIMVGYAVRTSELAGDRDATLTSAAQRGSAQLSAIIDAATVTARASSDPAAAADALASVYPRLGICVVDAAAQACAGGGPALASDDVDREQSRRRAAEVAPDPRTDVVDHDEVLTIEAVGPNLTVFASVPADIVDARSGQVVHAATRLPADADVGDFSVDEGRRQTSASVDAALGVFVVAIGANDVDLPSDEFRFYLIIFSLAVALMLLAGVTLFVEQRTLVERANFDALTKLPNRSEFERRADDLLSHADRDDAGVCLLLFDLNGFKQVNDTHGHHVGDEVLKVIGSRLRQAVRDRDVVARWGGDEFVVVMPGISSAEMGSRRALQLAEQVGGRTRLDGLAEPIRVKVSVGIAIWPEHGGSLEELVVAADQAMYEAKRDRVTCRVASPPSAPVELTHTHA